MFVPQMQWTTSLKDLSKMKKFSHLAYISVIIFLVSILLVSIFLPRKEKVIEHKECQIDTVYLIKVDTLVLTKEKIVEVEKERIVVDTVYVDDTPIPITRHRFADEGNYDIYASGYQVSLESITIYPKTEYKYITKTIEKTIKETQGWDFYFGGGFEAFNRGFIPQVSLGVETPKKALFVANLGYYNGQVSIGGKALVKIGR